MARASSRDVYSATRIHFPVGTTDLPEVAVDNLRKYATSTHALRVPGGIAVNCLQEEIQAVVKEAAPDADIQVLHVPVWGAFVPALNTLLGEAQRRHAKYILFQSLEVACHPAILRRLLDFHTSETLVVGPVLNGHIFTDGLQTLNGRTTPWNTLAVWSTRKLGLTGFLSVAEGLPDAGVITRQFSGDSADGQNPQEEMPAMGSEGWWDERMSQVGLHATSAGEVPAGVEEVTATALLQHLLGEASARAVLIELPKALESKVTWKTNWGGDEKRRQWHEYKMNTKITRPAAQVQQLFGNKQLSPLSRSLSRPLLPEPSAIPEGPPRQERELNFGIVHHFGEFISPPLQVELICLFSYALFMANSASAFSMAFKAINVGYPRVQQVPTATVGFVGLWLAGVYLPMPLSLVLIRWLSVAAGHKAALLFFATVMTVTPLAVALIEFAGVEEEWSRMLLIMVRLLQGFGGAVLFQARVILSQLSTQDKHVTLQAKTFLAGDLGLGLGALLPYACSQIVGMENLTIRQPEILASCSLSAAGFILLLWVVFSFPQCLYRLSHRVRFPTPAEDQATWEGVSPRRSRNMNSSSSSNVSPGRSRSITGSFSSLGDAEYDEMLPVVSVRVKSEHRSRISLLVSGTLRVFVQSAALMAVAVNMRDMEYIGDFRQSFAVAMLCLAPVPFEALVAGMYSNKAIDCAMVHGRKASIVVFTLTATICVATTCWLPHMGRELDSTILVIELILLQVCMAFVAPMNVSKLYRHHHMERSLVVLEWAKAYLGRLLGPVTTLLVHDYLGSGPLLVILYAATAVVALTA